MRALAILLLLLAGTAFGADDLVIRNVRIVDGTGKPATAAVSILVRDGRIAEIAPNIDAASARVLDAAGAFVVPGLIDTHVHFFFAPGSAQRGETPESIGELNRQHLRAYVACGVTTVLDPGAYPPTVRAIQAWLAAGNPGPRFLTTGPLMRPKDGYGHPLYGSESTVAEVEEKLDLIQSLGGVGVKLAIEPGTPEFSAELRDAIRNGAARRHLPLYIHATSEASQNAALDFGAHAIMHSAFGGAWKGDLLGTDDLSDQFIARLKTSGAYQLTTFSLLDTWPGLYDPARLDDPLVQLTVPAVEIKTARDPASTRLFAIETVGFALPWTYELTRPWLASFVWTRANLIEGLHYSQRNILKLHRAGVPIVAATDAPSPWPIAFNHFHGPQTAREVELLKDAGLSPADALAAVTRVPAEMLGLANEIGTIEVGKRADLAIVDGNPLDDITALHRVRWTVRDGVARTPAEWMGGD